MNRSITQNEHNTAGMGTPKRFPRSKVKCRRAVGRVEPTRHGAGCMKRIRLGPFGKSVRIAKCRRNWQTKTELPGQQGRRSSIKIRDLRDRGRRCIQPVTKKFVDIEVINNGTIIFRIAVILAAC